MTIGRAIDTHDALCYKFCHSNKSLFWTLFTIGMTHQTALGLGSNIGDSEAALSRAVDALGDVMTITAVSPLYRTAPWGKTDQPDLYNLCLTAKTDATPHQLLTQIKQFERDLGRTPNERWGPRLIDIDILLFDDVAFDSETLTIPHRHLPDRAFVLLPLRDIAPDWVHPTRGETIAELAAAVSAKGVTKVAALDPKDFASPASV